MTYREKLQMEYPENVNPMYIGGCKGCPSGMGYGPESCINNGCVPDGVKCTKCWDTVIPGTEDKKYENLSRDELLTIIKLLEGRIDVKDELISRYTAACTDKNKEIATLKDQIKKLEQENETYSRVCDIYKSKDAIIDKQEKEIKELEMRLAVYRSQAMQTYDTCCCKPDVITEKDKEIKELKELYASAVKTGSKLNDEWWRLRSENLNLRIKIDDLERALEKEKKEHAKHHGWLGIFWND